MCYDFFSIEHWPLHLLFRNSILIEINRSVKHIVELKSASNHTSPSFPFYTHKQWMVESYKLYRFFDAKAGYIQLPPFNINLAHFVSFWKFNRPQIPLNSYQPHKSNLRAGIKFVYTFHCILSTLLCCYVAQLKYIFE